MNQFSKLGLSESTLSALDKLGFTEPTPIQQQAIPLILQHDPTDFIGLAQTGTGKTAAFGLPLVELVDDSSPEVQALIMAPTRELGQQTAKELVSFSKGNKNLNVEVVYGGSPIVKQIKALKRPVQIVVATPGRLLDLIRRKAIRLDNVRHVVLDEADEMLNMGFKEDIDSILSYTEEGRSIWLFSATMPDSIRRIVKKYMDNPKEVSVMTEQKSNKDITHKYVVTKVANKVPALRRFLEMYPEMRGVLFCRTRRETRSITDELGRMGYIVEALNGDLSQAQRDEVMKRFRKRSMQLLIATDVAARGIDVKDLTHVLHHSLPDQLEYYTHRSGRTGRAGSKGTSLVFINPREGRKIKEIERKMSIQFEKVEIPSLEELKESRITHWADLIVNTKVDGQADGILTRLNEKFADLSKDDILKRLITTQLDHLDLEGGGDLNETAGTGKRRKGDDSSSHSSDQTNRYFINIGSIDGVTMGDLLHFLADVSGIDRKYFGDISLQKNCAYFDVDKTKDRSLGSKFKGIDIDGRWIRVNRDDDGNKKRSGGGKKYSGKKRSGGKSGGGRKGKRKDYGGSGRKKRFSDKKARKRR